MKVLIYGSREMNTKACARRAIKALQTFDLKPNMVIHGGARGADMAGELVAEHFGAQCTTFRPDWEKDGKSAGFKRNTVMVDQKPDLAICFWDGESRGTLDTIKKLGDADIMNLLY